MGATQNKPAESESSDSEEGSSSSNSDEESEESSQKEEQPASKKPAKRAAAPQPAAREVAKSPAKNSAKNSARSSCSSAASSSRSATRLRQRTDVPQIICNCCGGGGMETGAKEYLSGVQPQQVLQSNQSSNNNRSSFDPEAEKGGEANSNAGAEKISPKKPGAKAGKSLVSDLASLAAPPKQDDDDDGTASVGGRSARSDFSMRTADVAQHSAGPPGDAAALKAAIKEFVRSMVKGRDMHLQPRVGELRPLTCCLTPETDAFLIGDRVPQRILMQEIMHVHQGLEALPLDLGYPLDQSHVVLELTNATCVSFHLGHPKAAEEFVLYMRLLTAMQRQKNRNKAPLQADNDDARSVCSDTRSVGTVQTGIMQQQLNSMPMSSMNEDPKEAKRMFKMFKETMKRGKEFYVVKMDGKMQDVECKLMNNQEVFLMRWDFQTRNIPLRDMLNVLTCHQAAELRLGYPLDELCATIELQTGECITFKFGHIEACDRFVFCMRVLVGEKRQRFVSNDLATPQMAMMSSAAAPAELGDGCLQSRSARRGSRSAPSSAREAPTSNGPQAEVEAFVRQMVAGCKLNVVGGAGLTEVMVSMDTDLRAFQLTASDKSRRDVIVSNVKAVHVGTEANKLGLDGVAIDQLCVTLELKSDDCLTFRFPELQQRDRFALCVRIFASAHQK